MLGSMVPLKDELLSRLAAEANVAQFLSFGPGPELGQRHAWVRGHPPGRRFPDPAAAVEALLAAAPAGSVNVRSFRAGASKGGPFTYGLTRRDDVLAVLRSRAGEGLHTIANETIDVEDGGVSGVALGGLVELAPGDTPRAVERPGTAALGHDAALRLLGTVYGFRPDLAVAPGERVEFSIHPLVAGFRRTHTVLWEREPAGPVTLTRRLVWPNAFSRFLGDKAFGLIVADLHDLPVPATTVVGRRVAPFSFGRPTGGGERWLRTCPPEPVPGRFPTRRGWSDPFALLAAEDPDGTQLGAVLAQEGSGPAGRVRPCPEPAAACWSRASRASATTSCSPGLPRPPSRPGSPTTSAASAPERPPPSARSASNGPTTATRPGSSSSTWPRWPPRPPPSPRAPRPAGTASTPRRAWTTSAT
jgi:hypothetical protein